MSTEEFIEKWSEAFNHLTDVIKEYYEEIARGEQNDRRRKESQNICIWY